VTFAARSGFRFKVALNIGAAGVSRGDTSEVSGGVSLRCQGRSFGVACIYLGGCSSLLNQPATLSVFSGSAPSQSRHWNVRCPLPPGGSARIKKAPQWGQVGRSACPIR
jgi:hypothetical protein